jgi:hypothetical protein
MKANGGNRATVLRHLRALRHRIGFRGATLLFFAVIDLGYGWSLANPLPEAERSATIRWADTLIPLPVWAAWWLTTAAVCVWYAFRPDDRLGFAAAAVLKGATGMVMATGWAFGYVQRGWVSAVIWLVMAGWVTLIAHWPEPPPRPT